MNKESEWELVFSDFKKDEKSRLALVQLPREFYRHTIRIQVDATSIPSTWRTAGWLYHRLNHFTETERIIAQEYRVLVNCQQIIQLPTLTDRFYLEYLPAKWYIWQDIKIWYWVKGK